MIITQAPVNIKLPASDTPRAPGIHASGIIRNIAMELGILKGDFTEDAKQLTDIREITDEVAILRMAIGLAWEDFYISKILAAEGVNKHPGEMSSDGISMNPDGESLERIKGKHHVVIHEVKATYKSINRVAEAEKEWMWLTQIKCYCRAANTRFGRLHVLFLCGDYKFPIRPDIRRWNIEFTKKELDENWELMTAYRDQRS
jgi:hypothetical protein